MSFVGRFREQTRRLIEELEQKRVANKTAQARFASEFQEAMKRIDDPALRSLVVPLASAIEADSRRKPSSGPAPKV